MIKHLSAFLDALERADPLLGGAGPWVATALLVAAFALVSRDNRPRTKLSLWFLLAHLALGGVLAATPKSGPAEAPVRLLAATMLMASIARSTFLLFVHSFWMRKVALPLPKILRDVVQAVIFALAFLVVLRSAGVNPSSLLTTSALLTAVIGLSLQDTLGNLFAGLAIQAQRPFAVGDWIQLDGENRSIGRVIEINWRATRVITLEQIEITIPNGQVAKSSITNFSRPKKLVRREVEVQAPYEVPPEFIRQVLLSGMDHVYEVLSEPAPRVFTKDFTERGIGYVVRYFIEEFHDREIIDSAVHDRMWYALRRANVVLPVPRRQVELRRTRPPTAEDTEDPLESVKNLLAQVSLFEALPGPHLAELAEKCRRKRYTSEEIILHKGEASTEMYVIESGQVRIEVPDERGSARQVIGSLERGDFFGEMSLMTGAARTADVVANQETTVQQIRREALEPLLEKYPRLAEHMSRVLADRKQLLDDSYAAEPEKSEDSMDEAEEEKMLRRIRRLFSL